MSKRQAAGARLCSLVVIAFGASSTIFSAPVLAGNPPTSGQIQRLPQKVTLKTDMVFHVPFSVTGDTVPVKAGTEVMLKDLRGDYLKLAYGLGELVVDPSTTDLADRLQNASAGANVSASGVLRQQNEQLPSRKVSDHTSKSTPAPLSIPAKPRQPVQLASAPSPRPQPKKKPGVENFEGLASFVILLLLIVGIVALVRNLNVKPKVKTGSRHPISPPDGRPTRAELTLAIDDLDWFQLERLVAALFQAKGNSVELRGGANADGGIDLVVDSGSTRAAVQCKHWSKWKCGPGVVRELIGAMKHEGFSQGFLVCRTATAAALDLAAQERITIVDHDGLIERIDAAIDADNEDVRRLLFAPEKLCPKCGVQMVRRTAAKGSNAGSEFWGCSKYPDCRQTMRF